MSSFTDKKEPSIPISNDISIHAQVSSALLENIYQFWREMIQKSSDPFYIQDGTLSALIQPET